MNILSAIYKYRHSSKLEFLRCRICVFDEAKSATNRKRTYWTNIPQPKEYSKIDEKLQDILDCGYTNREKGLCILESCSRPLKNPVKIASRVTNKRVMRIFNLMVSVDLFKII